MSPSKAMCDKPMPMNVEGKCFYPATYDSRCGHHRKDRVAVRARTSVLLGGPDEACQGRWPEPCREAWPVSRFAWCAACLLNRS